ncbi:MAG: hypothetical protein ABIP85_11060 [Chthoniobacteraceae bacterium]
MTEAPKTNGSNFFSSGLHQTVDQLMDILYAGGVNNPMDSIEQCSYLLFLRLLTEKDEILASLDKKYARIFSANGRASRGATSSPSPATIFSTPSATPSRACMNSPASPTPAGSSLAAPR